MSKATEKVTDLMAALEGVVTSSLPVAGSAAETRTRTTSAADAVAGPSRLGPEGGHHRSPRSTEPSTSYQVSPQGQV
jgi:hypothetical protein